jgi:anti-sigma regulatory factor (Ser/Thr protein kinase)
MHTDEPAGAQRSDMSDSLISPGEAPGSVPLGSTSIPSNADAPRAARAAIHRWMHASFPLTVLQDAQLLISELVSNSFQHAGPADSARITVSAGTLDGVVWFDVADVGGRGGVARRAPQGYGGMGLNMVNAAASRWGTSRGDSTHVWFELPVRPPHAPLRQH